LTWADRPVALPTNCSGPYFTLSLRGSRTTIVESFRWSEGMWHRAQDTWLVTTSWPWKIFLPRATA
jgi:hypothetical protein